MTDSIPNATELTAANAVEDVENLCRQIPRLADALGKRRNRPQNRYSVHSLQNAVRLLTGVRDSLLTDIETHDALLLQDADKEGSAADPQAAGLISMLRKDLKNLGDSLTEARVKATYFEGLWADALNADPTLAALAVQPEPEEAVEDKEDLPPNFYAEQLD